MIRGPQTAGLLTGLALAAAFVLTAAPGSGPPVGLDLRITATPSGAVGVAPVGAIVTARTLRPGDAATGRAVLRNHTPARLAVRPAVSGARDADAHLRVRLDLDRTTLYDGTVAGLRAARGEPILLASGASKTLSLRAWVPAGASDAAVRGRDADLSLTFDGEPVP